MFLAMVSSSQIKEQLARYLEDRISLAQFEDWFIPSTRDIRKSHSDAAIMLSFDVEGALVEHSSGILNDDEFRNDLTQLVYRDNMFVTFANVPKLVWNVTERSPLLVVSA